MNKNNLEIRLGIFFLLVLIVVVIMMELIGALGPLKPGIRIQTQFNNVLDLKKGDPVKVAGVAVGAVESIKLKNGAVLVTMVIDRDTGITTESPTTIKFLGMMGQNYVNIDFSTNGLPVQDGAMLQSIEQPDISQLMSKLDGVYGRPYIVHIDADGKAGKAFVLPQKDPDLYRTTMKSFNIPELFAVPEVYGTHDVAAFYNKVQTVPVEYRP